MIRFEIDDSADYLGADEDEVHLRFIAREDLSPEGKVVIRHSSGERVTVEQLTEMGDVIFDYLRDRKRNGGGRISTAEVGSAANYSTGTRQRSLTEACDR